MQHKKLLEIFDLENPIFGTGIYRDALTVFFAVNMILIYIS